MADVNHDHHVLGVIGLTPHPPTLAQPGAGDPGQFRTLCSLPGRRGGNLDGSPSGGGWPSRGRGPRS